jgi:molybdopterin/thiamine biosynthesis adenylyltransferase
MIVLLLMLAILTLGEKLALPKALRWAGASALWIAAVLIHITLPDGAYLRTQAGGDARTWAAFGVIFTLVMAYYIGISALRARASPVPQAAPSAPEGTFAAGELPRYARHILLREIGGAGQARLKAARVLVIGAGGLGSPALMYLAAAGVGTIGVIDDDLVDQSNLSRQIIHTQDRVGLPKVQSAQIAMAQINPFVTVLPYARKLDAASQSLIAQFDLILDGSDNMATRYLVNAACVAAGKPLISAALTQWEGQVSLYHPAANAPCYACIFPYAPDPDLAPACAQAGVVSPLPGVIGAIMALEAVKHLSGAGSTLAGRLLIYDALDARTQHITLARTPACPVCSAA